MVLTALVIGDPHFKVSNVKETTEMTRRILDIATQKQPHFIVCLGDVLDRHENIHVVPLEQATLFLNGLRQIAPLYVIIGNHDRPNNYNFLTTEHPFNALKVWPNTKIVDFPLLETISGHKFLFVPGEKNPKMSREERLFPFLQDVTAVFCHQEFINAKMGAIRSTEGDPWPLHWPYVISGHIHDFDQLATNLLYVGTPIQHAFGDRDDKTISWFTWEDPSSIQESVIPQHERLEMGLPRKIIVRLTCSEAANYVKSPDTQLKLIITGTSAEIKAAMKLDSLKKLASEGVKVAYDHVKETLPPSFPTSSTLKYSERFYEAVSSDPALKRQYERLFGRIEVGPILHLVA